MAKATNSNSLYTKFFDFVEKHNTPQIARKMAQMEQDRIEAVQRAIKAEDDLKKHIRARIKELEADEELARKEAANNVKKIIAILQTGGSES